MSDDGKRLLRYVVRDLVLISLAVLAWLFLAPLSAGAGWVADLSGWIAGLLVAASGSVLHEWGHLSAALVSRSDVAINKRLGTGFTFRFEPSNPLGNFVAMSLGGLLTTAVLVVAAYTLLPDGLLASRVARGGLVFLAMLGVVLEVPLLVTGLVQRRTPPPAAV